jgi:serine/threonine-protein kinase
VLNQQLSNQASVLKLFESESFIIAQLNHPHIIHVIDKGLFKDKTPYFIMEYLQGQDLSQLIQQGGMEINNKLDILIQVCSALGYAHKNGVIHRDIKPANIFIDLEGHAHVLDFGIAQFCNTSKKTKASIEDLVVGTLNYMSPEQQASSNNVTLLSDIYSLGVVMYVLFTGQKPLGNYARPSEIAAGIDSTLDQLILSCLNQDPLNRPSSADKIKDILLKLSHGTHLKNEQKQLAEEGITSLKKGFSLLDVIKEKKHSAIYLYENNNDHNLIIIKKRPVWSKGFDETNLLKPLDHEHIAKIYGTSKNERMYIIVMEYLNGGALQDRLIVATPWDDALRTLRGICKGLAFAHQNNVLHGNLRPSNILFDENGFIKLTDFGLDEHYQDGSEKNWYKLQSEEKTKRTDIFSAGIILYQLLTGALPRWKNKKIATSEKFDILPEQLKIMVAKMVHWSPLSRQNNIQQVLDEIDALLEYHLKLAMDEVKTQQWKKQRDIELAQQALKQAKRKKIIFCLCSSLSTLAIALLLTFYQEIFSLFNLGG